MEMNSSLAFTVERNEPEFIVPSEPTPYEFKTLSNIDDQKSLRFQTPTILFYRNVVGREGLDPVKVIREAIGKTLVYYYPFAGRLREEPSGKLVVECTGEGILFIEANANVRLEQFGDVLHPPFPGVEDLLYDVPGSGGVLNCPLLLIQVTRLMCGGFIFMLRLNHVMADAPGVVQFMTAVGEIASGAQVLSVPPVWERECLDARDPPQVSCVHHAYRELRDSVGTPLDNKAVLATRSFFFGPHEIACLKSEVSPQLRTCTKFDLITACLWRCTMRAFNFESDDEVRLVIAMNARSKFSQLLPTGFYGNATISPAAMSTSSELCNNTLGYSLELVKKAKTNASEEFMRSTADLLAEKSLPFSLARTCTVSDLTRAGFNYIDFGWGKPLYGGPTRGNPPCCFFVPAKNRDGEEGTVVIMDLPEPIMAKFVKEIEKLIPKPTSKKSFFIESNL